MCLPLHSSIILHNCQSSKGFEREKTYIVAQDQLFPDRMNDTDLALIGIVIASCTHTKKEKTTQMDERVVQKKRCVYSNETLLKKLHASEPDDYRN